MWHAWDAVLAAQNQPPNTEGLAEFLRDFFAPLFLVIISIVAIFFLFTREITRFVQFIILAIAIAILVYYPNVIETVAGAIVRALGFDTKT
jgi:hypothetical protein